MPQISSGDAVKQSAVYSQEIMEQQTSILCHDHQESILAQVNVITSHRCEALYLSILPSFLSCLSPSIHTLRISFVLSQQLTELDPVKMSSKLSYLSLERIENGVEKDGVANIFITINKKKVTVKFIGVERHGSYVEREAKSFVNSDSYADPYTCTFPLLRHNSIFAPVAEYSTDETCFIPITDDKSSSIPSLPDDLLLIVQLSVPPLPSVIPCIISRLPAELLSIVFSSVYQTASISKVCRAWRAISVPFWREPASAKQAYERLKVYPGAGRLWDELWFDENISVEMVKEVIRGSPNVTAVDVGAFWNEEEAETILRAVEGLRHVYNITFREGSRKWRKEEVENFSWRMGYRIRWLRAYGVVASVSPGLLLTPALEYLDLEKYPPLQRLFLPQNLDTLILSNLCPLPSTISDRPLPLLLDHLRIELAPFFPSGNTSILPTPLDLSYLTRLTWLHLDGGEETSNLVSRRLFSTLKNAKAIYKIKVAYCGLDSSDFPDFIRWFFADQRISSAMKKFGGMEMGYNLDVVLFFGEWHEEEIRNARMAMQECVLTEEIKAKLEESE
ncbi:hypothetical protein BT69DRAFT_605898 [Atractiella rhizophila]|nr:hypothetical protein BT69DRAFT_605898 [Atractiella rhizophila]